MVNVIGSLSPRATQAWLSHVDQALDEAAEAELVEIDAARGRAHSSHHGIFLPIDGGAGETAWRGLLASVHHRSAVHVPRLTTITAESHGPYYDLEGRTGRAHARVS